jgi:hypothetical protein
MFFGLFAQSSRLVRPSINLFVMRLFGAKATSPFERPGGSIMSAIKLCWVLRQQ